MTTLIKKTYLASIIAALILIVLGGVTIAVADDRLPDFTPLAPLPGLSDNGTVNPATFVEKLFRFGVTLAIFLTVIMITIGGFQYMTTDSMSKKGEGKKTITEAITGLVLVLISWLILNTVNPNLNKLPATLGQLKCKDAQGNELSCAYMARLKNGGVDNAALGQIAAAARNDIVRLEQEAADLQKLAETALLNGNRAGADSYIQQAEAKLRESNTIYATTLGENYFARAQAELESMTDPAAFNEYLSKMRSHYYDGYSRMRQLNDPEQGESLRIQGVYKSTTLSEQFTTNSLIKQYNEAGGVVTPAIRARQINDEITRLKADNNYKTILSGHPEMIRRYEQERQARITKLTQTITVTGN